MQPTDSPQDPVNQLAPKEPGAPAADDHDRAGPPAKEVIDRGYEEDRYDSKTVLSVPLLVILFFVLAFGTVSVIFYFIAYPNPDPRAHPGAAARNKRPLNERLNELGRGKEADQPRLDVLKQLDTRHNPRAITRPPLPTEAGNSPDLHPEDLRVSKDKFPMLYGTGPNKTGYGLDKTMELSKEALEKLFPVQKDGTAPANSRHVPTASNAGRGDADSVAAPPALPGSRPKEPAPPPKKMGDH